MAESDQSQTERDEALAQTSMDLVAHYATSVVTSIPRSAALKRKVLRENIRVLICALAEVDGNQNTCEFLEIQAVKRSNTPACERPTGMIVFDGPAKIIQFSERYRKTGRTT